MSDYLLAQAPAPDTERKRLRLLQIAHDPISRDQLAQIGVSTGWNCLDLGAGAGSVSRMMAERVGPTGRVLAVDLETQLLESRPHEGIEIRRLDLVADPLPEDGFDLVHARLLLIHLPARLRVLHKMVAATRPGGWVASVDSDFSTVAITPSEPVWQRVWSAFCAALAKGGWDYTYGARLAADLAAVGLVDVRAEYRQVSGPGGSIGNRIMSLNLERLRAQMLELGVQSAEIDEAQRLLEDPSRTISSSRICMAHGRRPPASIGETAIEG